MSIIYDWIFTILGNSDHELSTINMLYSLKKFVILLPYLPITATSLQWSLSSVPKVAVLERFDCTSRSDVVVEDQYRVQLILLAKWSVCCLYKWL